MSPLDPEQSWLAAGITGIPRQREWDAVGTADAPGAAGDEVQFVAFPDGRLHFEGGSASADLSRLAVALEGALDRPYRAVAVRRDEFWAVGACSIEVARLEPDPHGDDLELTWDGAVLALVVDGVPVGPSQAPALERIAGGREKGPYAAHAHRLEGDLWELLVLPL